MRIGFMVNDVQTELPAYTTIRLAMRAINNGDEAWLIGAGDFVYDTDEKIHAWANSAPKKKYKSEEVFMVILTELIQVQKQLFKLLKLGEIK